MMPLVRVFEHPFSLFLRDPRRVIADLQRGDVLLRRRGAPALRLSRADRVDDRASAFDALARLLRRLAVQDPAGVHQAALEAFPWASFLPARDQREFAAELSRVLAASAELESYAPVAQLLAEWRATAEVHADPTLSRALRRPLAASGEQVARPRR